MLTWNACVTGGSLTPCATMLCSLLCFYNVFLRSWNMEPRGPCCPPGHLPSLRLSGKQILIVSIYNVCLTIGALT